MGGRQSKKVTDTTPPPVKDETHTIEEYCQLVFKCGSHFITLNKHAVLFQWKKSDANWATVWNSICSVIPHTFCMPFSRDISFDISSCAYETIPSDVDKNLSYQVTLFCVETHVPYDQKAPLALVHRGIETMIYKVCKMIGAGVDLNPKMALDIMRFGIEDRAPVRLTLFAGSLAADAVTAMIKRVDTRNENNELVNIFMEAGAGAVLDKKGKAFLAFQNLMYSRNVNESPGVDAIRDSSAFARLTETRGLSSAEKIKLLGQILNESSDMLPNEMDQDLRHMIRSIAPSFNRVTMNNNNETDTSDEIGTNMIETSPAVNPAS